MGLDQSGVLTVGSLVPKEGRHTLPHNTLLVIPAWCSTRSCGGPGHGTLRWTRTSEQAGKALRSQGHHCARVM